MYKTPKLRASRYVISLAGPSGPMIRRALQLAKNSRDKETNSKGLPAPGGGGMTNCWPEVSSDMNCQKGKSLLYCLGLLVRLDYTRVPYRPRRPSWLVLFLSTHSHSAARSLAHSLPRHPRSYALGTACLDHVVAHHRFSRSQQHHLPRSVPNKERAGREKGFASVSLPCSGPCAQQRQVRQTLKADEKEEDRFPPSTTELTHIPPSVTDTTPLPKSILSLTSPIFCLLRPNTRLLPTLPL
ncbi:hypothetical protein LZ30DRAFT_462050 [Colletotrichum cereale]|nr:hypothetical protein LZ30DRAFT_462050 [Colletotrichum cereale]